MEMFLYRCIVYMRVTILLIFVIFTIEYYLIVKDYEMKIDISLSKKSVLELSTSAIAYFLPESFSTKEFEVLGKDCGFDILGFLQERKFTGAKGSSTNLAVSLSEKSFTHLLFFGLGKAEKSEQYSVETMRRAVGSAVKSAQCHKIESLALSLPESSMFGVDSELFLQDMYVVAAIAAYKFDTFLTKKDGKEPKIDVIVCVAESDVESLEKADSVGAIISGAINRARYLIDTPPSHLTPTDLADEAKMLAEKHGLACTIFDGKKIKDMGMGGLAGVARGSSQDPKFVILEYKAKKAGASTIGFVGKGITFDSGGLSIKPAASMETMKEDMAGAASVIQTLGAIAQLQPDVNVVGIAAITENMPGCSALKPGDIVTFYNGKTAEVLNTDAEGRLVLADALSYGTKHFELDCVIDIATLTGACIYAVGPFYSALLSDNQVLADRVKESAARSGDYVWQLPFNDDFKSAVKSDIADIKNIGDPRIAAGTITAACFLREFTGDVPWVHLDIASSSFNVPNIPYFGKGATGSSVRLMIDIAMNWKK